MREHIFLSLSSLFKLPNCHGLKYFLDEHYAFRISKGGKSARNTADLSYCVFTGHACNLINIYTPGLER